MKTERGIVQSNSTPARAMSRKYRLMVRVELEEDIN